MGSVYLPPKVDQGFATFLRELVQAAQRAQAEKLKSGLDKIAHRSSLPRPARFKGPSAPSARALAIYSAQARDEAAGPEGSMFRDLTDWKASFDPVKYASLVMAIRDRARNNDGDTADPLVDALTRRMWGKPDTGLRLKHCPDANCWTFNLSGQEADQARTVMKLVRDVVRFALESTKGEHEILRGLWQDYFKAGDSKSGSNVRANVRDTFARIQTPLFASTGRIVISKSKMSTTEVAVQAFIADNQNVNECAEVHVTDRFFMSKPGFGPEEWNYFRASVIVHELAHLYARKEDVGHPHCYGPGACIALPQAKQLKNADNYGLFAFEAAYLTMFTYGQTRFNWPR